MGGGVVISWVVGRGVGWGCFFCMWFCVLFVCIDVGGGGCWVFGSCVEG